MNILMHRRGKFGNLEIGDKSDFCIQIESHEARIIDSRPAAEAKEYMYKQFELCMKRNKSLFSDLEIEKRIQGRKMGELKSKLQIRKFIKEGLSSDLSYVYVIHDTEFVKIGKSNRPMRRMSTIKVGNPRDLVFFAIFAYSSDSDARHAESSFHRAFSDFRVGGEWFSLSDESLASVFDYAKSLEIAPVAIFNEGELNI